MFGLGTPELIVIFAIILLLFGSSALPKLARSVGESAKELRNGLASDSIPAARADTATTDTPQK